VASPQDFAPLRLDEEICEIDKIQTGPERDTYQLIRHFATRWGDLQEALLRHRPHVVHFSGHGKKKEEISVVEDQGAGHPVDKQSPVELFEILKDDIRIKDLQQGVQLVDLEALLDHMENGTTSTLTALLQRSTDRLDEQTRDCFAFLGAFAPRPAAFDLDAMAAVCEMDNPKPIVRNLVGHGLLEPTVSDARDTGSTCSPLTH
jgi:hypothetical protein